MLGVCLATVQSVTSAVCNGDLIDEIIFCTSPYER